MLSVTPRVSMFDAPVVISASQLKPTQKVTIKAKIDHPTGKFESRAQFVADDNGNLNLSTDRSFGGTYEGIHPMGLFTTLEQSPGQKAGLRLMPRIVDQPMVYSFEIFNGHGDVTNDNVIANTTAERHFIHPAVERREIEIGRLRGSLFCLKSKFFELLIP
uniref:Acyl-CoA thioester hydrolase/bile acid-CoA amino acid N-acetyltransferase domain-containing protein n=1 Tax=Plectus sambesii TaxID=2011161 RepID=A0A914WNK0_9BILA